MKIKFLIYFIAIMQLAACSTKKTENQADRFEAGSFGYDRQFLSKYQETIVLSRGNSRLAICPAYQGRVMTSSSGGDEGLSYGWLNYKLIESGEILDHINPVGGEDRFWLGPEGGQYSIFFKKGADFEFEDWQTPAPIDFEPFEVVSKSENAVKFSRTFQVQNYSGTLFPIKVDREISFVTEAEIAVYLELPDQVEYVAFQSTNTITNTGNFTWDKETGALSIWILGMFNPSESTTIIIPYNQEDIGESFPIVNDDYFGKVPKSRLKVREGIIYFLGDGNYRSKIGLSPLRARPYLGSYDEQHQVLTVVFYTKPEEASDYVNSMWEHQEKPFAGDAINSYNDGPNNGNTLGPFYELETSSPAAFLSPGENLTHRHVTIHMRGSTQELDTVVRKLFGVSLTTVTSIF